MIFFSLAPIHAEAPEFVEMSVEQEILETGIKVVDMLAPYAKGGKIGETPDSKTEQVHNLKRSMKERAKSFSEYIFRID